MRQFAVVGSPIDHSLSPALHSAAYRELGIEDAAYLRYDVSQGCLKDFLTRGDGANLQGVSVTMPLKPEAHALASESCHVSSTLGVANTLLRKPDGTFRAENHDVYGIVQAIRSAYDGPLRHVGILGSGATAVSAVLAAHQLGVAHVMLAARRPEALGRSRTIAGQLGMTSEVVAWPDSSQLMRNDAVISALAKQGAESLGELWGQRVQASPRLAFDVLYDPRPTPFSQMVGEDTVFVDGSEMLVHQADMQLRSMLGISVAPLAVMRRVFTSPDADNSPASLPASKI